MLTKSYKAKSSVRRAAKGMEGFHMDTLEILQDENGEWYGTDGWGSEDQQEVVLESNEDLETKMEVALEEPTDEEPVIGDFVNCPHCGVHLDNGCRDNVQDWEEYLAGKCSLHLTQAEEKDYVTQMLTTTHQFCCMGCNEDFGPEVKLEPPAKAQKAKGSKAKADTGQAPEKLKASSVTNPCQMVWNICEEMKGTRRGIVLQACVDKGVAFNTARTQYQQWLVASRGETK